MHTYRRRLTREKVLQVLYAYELSKEPIALLIENILSELKPQKEDWEFAQKLIYDVIQHQEEINKFITTTVAHWELNRIAVIDKVLLNMGICELLYFPDIPPKVTINEAIEIAKAFSTEKSGKFINGVLDAVLEGLKGTHALHKTGRGLINESSSRDHRTTGPQSPSKRK